MDVSAHETTPPTSGPDAPRRGWTLRVQLLAGLGLMLPAVAVSAGLISHWSAERQLTGTQLRHLRLLGQSAAVLVAPALTEGTDATSRVPRVLSELSAGPYLGQLEVVDRDLRRVAGHGRPTEGRAAESSASRQLMQRAIRTEQQLVRVAPATGGELEVVTPVYASRSGQIVGAIRFVVPLSDTTARPLLTFWVLMAVDSLVLMLFVGFVVTRYVVRPIEALHTAASMVAEGDLSVSLSEQGAHEVASLARAFNRMTAAVRDQLRRLEQQRQSLIQAEKLASVGRLAAGVAHEVGNPMQSIVGYTDMLLDGDLDEPEKVDALRRIQQESQRIHVIVGELLDYARPVSQDPEPTDLHDVVQHALGLTRAQRRFAGIDVHVDPTLSQLPPARARATKLVQVVINLLLNAADAMDDAGTIRIASRYDEREVEVRFRNSGPEISVSDRDRVFDLFFTTKEPGQGTGLGLAVARSIVESFGGRLTLDPAPETTFVMTLPRHEVLVV